MKIKLDDWQKEIMAEEEHHILLAKGRRIGATHLFAQKAVEWLKTHHNPHPTSQIVCASLTIDQAQLLIAFATAYAQETCPELIGRGKDKPTLNKLVLKVIRIEEYYWRNQLEIQEEVVEVLRVKSLWLMKHHSNQIYF